MAGSLRNTEEEPSGLSHSGADDMKAVQEVLSKMTTVRSQVCLPVVSASHARGSDTGILFSPGQGG